MSDNHRDSLIDHSSKTNPFELLQTIPVSNMEPTGDPSSYVVPQPRVASKSKKSRSRSRKSEPTQSLAQGINHATQKLKQQSKTAGNSRATSPGGRRPQSPQKSPPRTEQEDDLLGIFGDLGGAPAKRQPDRPALGNSQSQPHPHANAFDYWDPVQDNLFGSALQTPQLTPANSNSKASSVASSVENEELFDPHMWELDSTASDFFDAEAQRASQQDVVQPAVGLVMPGFDEDNDDDGERSDESESKGLENTDENKTTETTKRSGRKKNDGDQEEDTKQADETPTNCLVEMHRGTALLKYPRRHGFPHFKHVQLARDNKRIQWYSKRKSLDETCIAISDIREIRCGQKTETFQKFHQEVLEKASFSIVFGDNYRTFDVVAKSTDECNMWVKALKKLKQLSATGADLEALHHLDVGIAFKDRNRPKSRQGSGNFIRAHNSRQLKIDPVAQKQIERDMDALRRNYQRTVGLANRSNITRSDEWDNISQVLSELEERIEELTHEVLHTRDTDMSKRDVWRANVDLTAIQEKTEVLLKLYDSNGRLKR